MGLVQRGGASRRCVLAGLAGRETLVGAVSLCKLAGGARRARPGRARRAYSPHHTGKPAPGGRGNGTAMGSEVRYRIVRREAGQAEEDATWQGRVQSNCAIPSRSVKGSCHEEKPPAGGRRPQFLQVSGLSPGFFLENLNPLSNQVCPRQLSAFEKHFGLFECHRPSVSPGLLILGVG